MLSRLFTWFYCLDFGYAIFWLLLFTAIFCLLRERFGQHRLWKAAVMLLIALWAAALLAQTVFLRDPDSKYTAVWAPLQSYRAVWTGTGNKELLRSNFMNVALFYPAGLLLASLIHCKIRKAAFPVAILAAVMLSGAIEYAQYRWRLGVAQTDDILHNTLGAALGAAALHIPWQKAFTVQQ